MNRWTEKQMDRKIDGQTNTDKQIDEQTNTWTDEYMERQADGQRNK